MKIKYPWNHSKGEPPEPVDVYAGPPFDEAVSDDREDGDGEEE